jgi:hypothetical protein
MAQNDFDLLELMRKWNVKSPFSDSDNAKADTAEEAPAPTLEDMSKALGESLSENGYRETEKSMADAANGRMEEGDAARAEAKLTLSHAGDVLARFRAVYGEGDGLPLRQREGHCGRRRQKGGKAERCATRPCGPTLPSLALRTTYALRSYRAALSALSLRPARTAEPLIPSRSAPLLKIRAGHLTCRVRLSVASSHKHPQRSCY